MKVSIIIPVYNRKQDLPKSIRSALAQNYDPKEYEIVIIDDGSQNGTREFLSVVSQYEDKERVRVIHHDQNAGLPSALNTGLRAARGMYFYRLDADDTMMNNALEMLVPYLDYNKEWDYVWADFFTVDEQGNILERRGDKIGCNALFRKSTVEELGLYDPEFRIHEDRDLWMRLEKAKKVGGYVHLPLYKYYQHPNSLSHMKENLKYGQLLIAKHTEKMTSGGDADDSGS